MGNKVRVQLDYAADEVERFENLRHAAGIATRKELFDTALATLSWALEEKRKGRIIASLGDDLNHIKELVMPAFDHVKKH